MPRTTRYKTRSSKKQLRELVNFMMKNADFARENLLGPDAAKTYEETWQRLANYLTDFGPQRSILQWKATWRSLKTKARSRNVFWKRTKFLPPTEVMPAHTDWRKQIMSVMSISNNAYANGFNNMNLDQPVQYNNSTHNGTSGGTNGQYVNGGAAFEDDSAFACTLASPSLSAVNTSASKPALSDSLYTNANTLYTPSELRSNPNPFANNSENNEGHPMDSLFSRLSDIQEDNNSVLKNIGKTISQLLETTKTHNESITKLEMARLVLEKDRNTIERERNAIKREKNALIKEKNEILRMQIDCNTVTFKKEEVEEEEEEEQAE